MSLNVIRPFVLVTLSGLLLLNACRKPNDVVPVGGTSTGTATTAEVNDWILANMKQYYFWTDKLPANPDKTLAPDKFFLSLLYDRANTANTDRDRFSWIQQSADELKASLSGEEKTTGMEFQLYLRPSSSTDVVGSVLYVLPGSPAAKAGLKRGDVFYFVNGERLTTSNYNTLLNSNSDSYVFKFSTVSNTGLTDTDQSKTVSAIVYQADPVLMDSVYTVGSKKIGYVVYNQFVPGPNSATTDADKILYDTKLDNVFGKFKSQNITYLVLDLRYNPGGYVSSATKLASLIGKNISTAKIYYTQQWNPAVTTDFNKKYGAGWNTQNFVQKANNIGANLSRLYVLTTGRTASASELVINGLTPYMPVTTIGTNTVGKNVGSITLSDDTGKIKWGLQPITFKSANASGFTDYATGFVPAVVIKEPLNLKPLGDVSEPYLSEAIFQATGTRMARRAADNGITLPEVSSSLDRKFMGSGLIADKPGKH